MRPESWDMECELFHIPDKRESPRQKRVGSRARHVLRAGDMHQRQLDERCGRMWDMECYTGHDAAA